MRDCKRCLLNELQDEDYARHIYDYINSLPEETKTSAALLHERLEFCRACDCLINGMCKLCGCFVEVRAAKKVQNCPNKKW